MKQIKNTMRVLSAILMMGNVAKASDICPLPVINSTFANSCGPVFISGEFVSPTAALCTLFITCCFNKIGSLISNSACNYMSEDVFLKELSTIYPVAENRQFSDVLAIDETERLVLVTNNGKIISPREKGKPCKRPSGSVLENCNYVSIEPLKGEGGGFFCYLKALCANLQSFTLNNITLIDTGITGEHLGKKNGLFFTYSPIDDGDHKDPLLMRLRWEEAKANQCKIGRLYLGDCDRAFPVSQNSAGMNALKIRERGSR